MRNYFTYKRDQFKKSGFRSAFTLVELIVALAIIGILASITIVSYSGWKQTTIVTQVKSDLNNVSAAMENTRSFGSGYPSSVPSTFSPSSGVTLSGGSSDGGKTYCVSAVNSEYPTLIYHIDSINAKSGAQPGVCATWIAGSGTLAGKYVRSADLDFTYQYKTSQTNVVSPQGATNTDPSYTSNYSLVSPQAYTSVDFGAYPAQNACKAMGGRLPTMQELSAIYSGKSSYGNNFKNTVYASATENTTANSYVIWFNDGAVGTPAKDGPNFNVRCVKGDGGSIAAPSAPTVTASTTGPNTTWSWGAAVCGANNARYQYRYTISPSGFDSGLVSTAATSITFSTATAGQTYTVAVQAECYNNLTASGMSTAGSAAYTRAVTTYTLTIAAGSGGSVNTGGTYNSGTNQTITATPNTGYQFDYWTGSDGCKGTISHTITMDGNKSCTASFITTPIAMPATPVVTATTAGATTTWSWGAVSCPANSTRYQYRYTITPSGYDSGWSSPITSTSVSFTTSTTGQTYKVEVQAQCYNASASSSWSGTGSDDYYGIIKYTLSLTAGIGGSVSGGGTYDESTSHTMTATPSSYHAFTSWTGSTGCAGTASHSITMDGNKSCTANFTPVPPAAPTVTSSSNSTTTTWSWGAATCGVSTARYQYKYKIWDPNTSGTNIYSSNSGNWTTTSSRSVSFTTSTAGLTYVVEVQAQCYNASATGGWSATGSNSYYRIIQYDLTLAASIGGSVSGGGTYNESTSHTMAATPSSYHTFTSWTGSDGYTGADITGCSGAASHSITMDNDKYCTANFTPNTPTARTLTHNTSGPTTTWSWNAVTCGVSTAGYQYRYYNSIGYDSGWTNRSSTSVSFTTSTGGVTYTVQVKANCYNADATGGWSAISSDSYTSPLATYTLTLQGANATYVGAGTYTEGTYVTMTATPNLTYFFNYWSSSPDTDCAGAASHTILMDSDKVCTATVTHWMPAPAGYNMIEGKDIYYQDSGTYAYRTTTAANTSPYGSTSASEVTYDPTHPTYNELVSPQVHTSVDFSSFPGQNSCKSTGTGGRLPNGGELANIITINTLTPTGYTPLVEDWYMTAGEPDYNRAYYEIRNVSNNNYGVSSKTVVHRVRCIRD